MNSASWMLPDEVFSWLSTRLRPWDKVVELGSGEGTKRLARMVQKLWTIEHDERFLGGCGAAQYIHAPIRGEWYDPAAIRAALPPPDFSDVYRCVVVDGPPGAIGRTGLLEHMDLFADVPFVFDDTHRPAERELAFRFAAARGKNLSIHCLQSGRSFATVGWSEM